MNRKLVSKNKSFTKRLLGLTTIILLSIVLVACGKSDEEILEGAWTANTQEGEMMGIYTMAIDKDKNVQFGKSLTEYGKFLEDTSYQGTYFRKGDNFVFRAEEQIVGIEDGKTIRKDEDELTTEHGVIKIIDENHIEVDGLEFERYES